MTHGDGSARAFLSPLETVLYACSEIYQIVVRFRQHLYDKGVLKQKGLPCKVVSVGNLTVGGTGKTPMVCYVADFLKGLGLEVAVVSRGYRGSAQRLGGIVSDGSTTVMELHASGDEPQLLASKLMGVPVVVGKERYRAGKLAINRFGSTVLVLDDAFEHLALKRDLDLLLLDSRRPFGNGHCIPRGTLREPVEQIKRASAFVLTRCTGDNGSTRASSMIEAHASGRPIFRCTHVPERLFVAGRREPLNLADLKGRRLLVFSGIARNDSFRETVSGLGGRIEGLFEFADHHRYSRDDLGIIWNKAQELNVENIITTEKDYINILPEIPSVPELLVLGICISFEKDTEAFERYLKSQLT
jgi:tetraacyldisaccharide 4'-kinase